MSKCAYCNHFKEEQFYNPVDGYCKNTIRNKTVHYGDFCTFFSDSNRHITARAAQRIKYGKKDPSSRSVREETIQKFQTFEAEKARKAKHAGLPGKRISEEVQQTPYPLGEKNQEHYYQRTAEYSERKREETPHNRKKRRVSRQESCEVV